MLTVGQFNAGAIARLSKSHCEKARNLAPNHQLDKFNMWVMMFTHSSFHMAICQEAEDLHKFEDQLTKNN